MREAEICRISLIGQGAAVFVGAVSFGAWVKRLRIENVAAGEWSGGMFHVAGGVVRMHGFWAKNVKKHAFRKA